MKGGRLCGNILSDGTSNRLTGGIEWSNVNDSYEHPNMTAQHEDIREQLSAYLDGELDAAVADRVEAAVAQRPDVADLLGELRRTRHVLRRLPPVGPEAGFCRRVMAEARRRGLLGDDGRRDSPWPGRVAAAAVLLFAVGVGVVVSASLWPPEPASRIAGDSAGGELLARVSDEDSPVASGGPAAGGFRAKKTAGSAGDKAGRKGLDYARKVTADLGASRAAGPGGAGKDAYKYKKGKASTAGSAHALGHLRGRRDELEAIVTAALAERLAAPAFDAKRQAGISVDEIRLEVTDPLAAQRRVQRLLAMGRAAPTWKPAPVSTTCKALISGMADRGNERAFRWYQTSPAQLYCVVSGDSKDLSRLTTELAGLRGELKKLAGVPPSRLSDMPRPSPRGPVTTRSAATSAPRPVVAPPPTAPQEPDAVQGKRRYEVSQITRRPVAKPPASGPSGAADDAEPTTAPATLRLGVLVITLTAGGGEASTQGAAEPRAAMQAKPAPEPAQDRTEEDVEK